MGQQDPQIMVASGSPECIQCVRLGQSRADGMAMSKLMYGDSDVMIVH